MKRDDDEQLWDLLGRAGQTEVSPFFARNVLRRIRQQPSWRARVGEWFRWRRLVPVTGVAVAVLAVAIFIQSPSPQSGPADSDTELDSLANIDIQDYEVIADLDELLTSDENSVWDENSAL